MNNFISGVKQEGGLEEPSNYRRRIGEWTRELHEVQAQEAGTE